MPPTSATSRPVTRSSGASGRGPRSPRSSSPRTSCSSTRRGGAPRAVRRSPPFMDESMAGLEDWTFPEEWTMSDGERVVTMWWNRLPGEGPDGRPNQAPGVSILHYAGDGRFNYELDVLNMAEVIEIIGTSGWTPPANFNAAAADAQPRHDAARPDPWPRPRPSPRSGSRPPTTSPPSPSTGRRSTRSTRPRWRRIGDDVPVARRGPRRAGRRPHRRRHAGVRGRRRPAGHRQRPHRRSAGPAARPRPRRPRGVLGDHATARCR